MTNRVDAGTFIFYVVLKRYDGDSTNYLIENGLVSIALLLMISLFKSLLNAFESIEIIQWNSNAVASGVEMATVTP